MNRKHTWHSDVDLRPGVVGRPVGSVGNALAFRRAVVARQPDEQPGERREPSKQFASSLSNRVRKWDPPAD